MTYAQHDERMAEATKAAAYWLSHCTLGEGLTSLGSVRAAYLKWAWGSGVPVLRGVFLRQFLLAAGVEQGWTPTRNRALKLTMPSEAVPLLPATKAKRKRPEPAAVIEEGPIGHWLRHCCKAGGWTSFLPLFRSYVQHAKRAKEEPLDRAAFRVALEQRVKVAWSKDRNRGFAVSLR